MVENLKKKDNIKSVESDLRNFPYWILSLESKGAYGDIRRGKEAERSTKVMIINNVMDKLDNTTREVIELTYFRDKYKRDDILKALMVDKNKYYNCKNKALHKFAIALGYK